MPLKQTCVPGEIAAPRPVHAGTHAVMHGVLWLRHDAEAGRARPAAASFVPSDLPPGAAGAVAEAKRGAMFDGRTLIDLYYMPPEEAKSLSPRDARRRHAMYENLAVAAGGFEPRSEQSRVLAEHLEALPFSLAETASALAAKTGCPSLAAPELSAGGEERRLAALCDRFSEESRRRAEQCGRGRKHDHGSVQRPHASGAGHASQAVREGHAGLAAQARHAARIGLGFLELLGSIARRGGERMAGSLKPG